MVIDTNIMFHNLVSYLKTILYRCLFRCNLLRIGSKDNIALECNIPPNFRELKLKAVDVQFVKGLGLIYTVRADIPDSDLLPVLKKNVSKITNDT